MKIHLFKKNEFVFAVSVFLLLSLSAGNCEAASNGTDSGEIFGGPLVVESSKTMKTSKETLQVFHINGFFFSENPESPFYRASFLSQGTRQLDPDGHPVMEASLIEAAGPDGDTAWVYTLWYYDEGPAEFYFLNGTGKWKGITGKGVTGEIEKRTDGGFRLAWEVEWDISADRVQTISGPDDGPYPNYAHCYSFHGPHIDEEERVMGNGLVHYPNHQKGVMLAHADSMENNPFDFVSGYFQGTTIVDGIRSEGGKVVSDVGLKTLTDVEGDSFWYFESWWYTDGFGHIRIIGGTGKWKGLTAVGETQGSIARREDDHHMLNFGVHWRLKE